VPDSQRFDQTSDPTLAKLLEVDSELAVQEAELLSQLAGVQEKRRSLKTVVSLFATVDDTALESPVQTLPIEIADVGKVAAPQLETARATATAEFETAAAPTPQSKVARSTPSPNRSNKNTRVTRTGKAAKQVSGWQQYLREEFRKTSLPEAVHLVLQRQAEQVFEIPAVLNAIFAVHLPEEVQSRVRRQITNILSEGVRKNKWYRGQLGCYSMSRAAAEANSASLR
jgi:hypothetical protein